MRSLWRGLVVVVVTAAMPLLAMANNQETADNIAKSLRESGQMSEYTIGVKCQQGTVWLKGQVRDQQQMNAALRLVFQHPGVTRVMNNLTIRGPQPVETAAAPSSSEPTTLQFAGGPGQVTRYVPPSLPQQAGPAADHFGQEQVPSTFSDGYGLGQSRRAVAVVGPSGENMAAAHTAEQPPQGAPQGVATQERRKAQRVASSFVPAPAQRLVATAPAPSRGKSSAKGAKTPAGPIPIAYLQQPEPMPPGAVPGGAPAAMPPPPGGGAPGGPMPMYTAGAGGGVAPARYDQPYMPNYAWPSYAAYPNYASLTYPRQYSPTAWPYIGPFYPYPQVPLGWRKVVLEWDDGWWMLDFKDKPSCGYLR